MVECPQCGRCHDAAVQHCPEDGSPLRSPGTLPRLLDHRYHLEQLLGRGGLGAVYRARDVRIDRLVAVKVVRPDIIGNPLARCRFDQEAEIVSRLQHPGIVAVLDHGTLPDGSGYLVMELVSGEDLRCVLVREGSLDHARAVRILGSVCRAVEAAHRAGVLHQDLKPENILLPAGEVDAKVLDFGVPRAAARHGGTGATFPYASTLLTAGGARAGTPAYMAPEQLRGHDPDARTNVFSLGVIAFEMLTGELPFGQGTPADVVLAQARGLAPVRLGDLTPAFRRAVRAALAADPDNRPPSPEAFAHLLGAADGL